MKQVRNQIMPLPKACVCGFAIAEGMQEHLKFLHYERDLDKNIIRELRSILTDTLMPADLLRAVKRSVK